MSRSYGITDNGGMYGLCEINRKFMVHDCYGYVLIPSAEAMAVLLALVPLANKRLLKGDIDVTVNFNNCFNNNIGIDSIKQEILAVVKALEEQGVDPFNLRPVGKGSHEPVADNSTEAGRAKNRRVEFIKK